MQTRPPCLPFLSPIGLRGKVSRSAASTVVNLSRLIGCGSFSLRPACSIRAVLALEASRPHSPTQFSVVNSLIRPTGLAPALAPASPAHNFRVRRRVHSYALISAITRTSLPLGTIYK